MRALRLLGATLTAADVEGRVLTHDLSSDLRKGTILGAEHVDRLRRAGEIHVVELEPGDVHEDEAAVRLGQVMAGDGVGVRAPVQSQVRLDATRRGLLRVDAGAVHALNHLPFVSAFTLFDGQAVEKGDEVAGAKVTPVAIPGAFLADAERIGAETGATVTVLPFRPLRTAIVVTEKLKPRARGAFSEAVSRKLGWYGAQLLEVREVARSAPAVRAAYDGARAEGAELILFAGASSIDPLDAAYVELVAAGGEVVRLGAPSHPGSMLWLGRLGGAPILGVASCAGFGKNTSLDLLLPFVFAYGRADAEDLVRLGHGGLVERAAGRSFPPYS